MFIFTAVVTSIKVGVMWSVRFVCHSFCLLLCLSVCVHDYYKSNRPIYEWSYQSEEVVNCWWWCGPGYGFWITFPLSLHCVMGILRDLLVFLIQSPADFHDTQWNDWRQQGNESRSESELIWKSWITFGWGSKRRQRFALSVHYTI